MGKGDTGAGKQGKLSLPSAAAEHAAHQVEQITNQYLWVQMPSLTSLVLQCHVSTTYMQLLHLLLKCGHLLTT